MYSDMLVSCCAMSRNGWLNFKKIVVCVCVCAGNVNFGAKDVVINKL